MHKSASRLTFIAEIKGLFKIFCHDGKKSYNYLIKIDIAFRKNRPQYILQKEKRFETKAKLVCVNVNGSICISDILSIVTCRLLTEIECIIEIKENVDFERHHN